MKLLLHILFISAFTIASFSQQDSVVYTRHFEFKEGIYLTIDQFRRNAPIPKSAVISTLPKNDLDFLTQVLEQEKFRYKDARGEIQEINSSAIWGYCRNVNVYVNFNNTFNRLNVIGNLCYFTAEIQVLASSPSPLYYNGGMATTYYNELKQFILHTETNSVKEFSVTSMEDILKENQELYNQFTKLRKREKANSIFVFLRKYNERYPLYIHETASL